jgi:hypothetical protein
MDISLSLNPPQHPPMPLPPLLIINNNAPSNNALRVFPHTLLEEPSLFTPPLPALLLDSPISARAFYFQH